MRNPEAFGACRSLVATPYDEHSWPTLCSTLDTCEEAELAEIFIPYLTPHLECWPAVARSAPWHWINGVFRGAPSPALSLVRTVDLRDRKLRPAQLERLLGAAFFAHVEQLYLQNNRLGIDDMGVLGAAPLSANLRVLALDKNAIFDPGLGHLSAADTSHLWQVEHLFLENTRVTTKGVELLADSPVWAKLNMLDLSVNRIDLTGYLELATAPNFARLDTLCLNEPMGSPHTLSAMLRSAQGHGFRHLRHLELKRAQVRGQDVDALCQSPMLDGLEVLDLSWNQLKNSAALALASTPLGRDLKVLDLRRNLLDDQGALCLLQSEHLRGLRTLHLEYNQISARMRARLVQSREHGWMVFA